jgi:predicted DNA-binding transcriptional regulator AlpA
MANLTPTKEPAAQVAVAKKAAELKTSAAHPVLPPTLLASNEAHIIEVGLEPDVGQHQRDRKRAHGARAPPAPAVRLIGKPEVCAIANATFPTIWSMMRAGTFPRARIVGGRSMWRSDEVDAWLAGLPVRPLKGDAPSPDTQDQPNQN